MKVLVEANNTPDIWHLGGSTAKLRIYALRDFQTSSGQWIGAGSPGQVDSLYLEISCTIVANVLTIPSFEIDSTVDALINPNARYSAELVGENGRRVNYLDNFRVNTLQAGDPSMTWGEIRLFRRMNVPPYFTDSLDWQISRMIQLAVGSLNKASENNPGVAASSYPAVDPTFPIHVSVTDPLWLQLQTGSGAGSTTIVDGAVVVNTSAVAADSRPFAFSLSEGAMGPFYVLPAEFVVGVSFIVRSRNLGDNGLIGWRL